MRYILFISIPKSDNKTQHLFDEFGKGYTNKSLVMIRLTFIIRAAVHTFSIRSDILWIMEESLFN